MQIVEGVCGFKPLDTRTPSLSYYFTLIQIMQNSKTVPEGLHCPLQPLLKAEASAVSSSHMQGWV